MGMEAAAGMQAAQGIFGTANKQTGASDSGYNFGLPAGQQLGAASGFASRMGQQIGTNAQQIAGQQGQLGNYQGQAAGSSSMLGSPLQLNTNFQGPQFGQGLDARGQALQSQELQNRMAGQERQQNQIAQQFRGNQGLASVLGAQSAAQSQLANNPLAFQAAEARNQQMISENQATNQAQQLGNQAQLGQLQGRSQQQQGLLSGLQNAAQFGQQQTNLGQTALNQQGQGLEAYGQKVQNQKQEGRSGGLLGK